ncbi:unnamed protein product [Lampetra planeri]
MCMVIFAPIFAILAFATCCGYHGELLFQLPCGNSSERLGDVHVPIQYPFRDGATVAMDAGRPSALPAGLAGVVPSARLLVAVGVVSLLYSLCATVATIFYQRNYLRNNRGPKIDVSVSLVLSLLWLLASCLWAASLAELRASLQPAHLGALVPACRAAAAAAAAAAAGRDPRAAALPQALPAGMVFGFINWLLWTGNVWFVYKETGWRAPSLRPLLRHGSAFCASEPDLAASTRRGDRGGGGAAASSAIGDRDFERAAGDHVLIDLGGQLGTSPKARLLQPQVSYHEYDNPCYTHGEDPPLAEARAAVTAVAAGPAERKGDARMMLAEEVQEVLYRRLGVAALPAETRGGEGAGAAGLTQATGRPPRARGARLSTGHSFSADDEDEDDEDDGGDDGKDIDGTQRPKKVYVSIPKLECHDDDDDDEDADGHGSGGSGGKRARPKIVHPSAVRKADGAEEASKRDAAIIDDLIKKGYLIVQNDGCGKSGGDDDDGAGGRPTRLRRQHPIAKRKYASGGSQRSALGRQSLDAGGSRFYCDDGDGGLADPHEARARKIHVSVQRRRSTGARSLNDVDFDDEGSREVGSYGGDAGGGVSSAEEIMVSCGWGSRRGGGGSGIGGGGSSGIGGGGGGVAVVKAARPASPTRRSSATLSRPRWAESRSCNSTDTLRVDAAACAGSSGGSMRLKSPERAWGERRASSVRHHHAAAGAGTERFKGEAGGDARDARGEGGGVRSRGRSTDGRGREGGAGAGAGGVDRGRSMDGRRKNSIDVVVDRGRSMDGRGKDGSGCNEVRGGDQLGNRLNLNRTSDYMFERRNSTSRIPARSGSKNLIVTNGGGGGPRNAASSGYATWATAGTAAIRTSASAGDQRNMASGAVTSATASATASATSSSWSRRDLDETTGPARRRRSRERSRERGRTAPRRKRRSATVEGAPRHAEDDEVARPVGREARGEGSTAAAATATAAATAAEKQWWWRRAAADATETWGVDTLLPDPERWRRHGWWRGGPNDVQSERHGDDSSEGDSDDDGGRVVNEQYAVTLRFGAGTRHHSQDDLRATWGHGAMAKGSKLKRTRLMKARTTSSSRALPCSDMSGREGGKKKPLKAPKKQAKEEDEASTQT